MPFNRWMLVLITTGWHARARLRPLQLACAFLAFAGTHVVYAADEVTPAPAATPEAAVRLFYPWYLGEMMKGRVPLTEEYLARFTALHCYDGVRPERLPPELQDDNPTGTWRLVDGQWTQAKLGR